MMTLSYYGKALRADHTIADYNIKEETQLIVSVEANIWARNQKMQ